MRRICYKIILYGLMMLLFLEALVRVFHLYNDRPERYRNDKGILAWVPGQTGYSVFGNRRQKMAAYRINNSGFNSHREYKPADKSIEWALLGDSFIEGFHQDYYNSIGAKIEQMTDQKVAVYEYGHSSNDLADVLHLVETYREDFAKIEEVIIHLNFQDDLNRAEYEYIDRKPVLPLLNHSKLYIYLNMIGLFAPLKDGFLALKQTFQEGTESGNSPTEEELRLIRMDNFRELINSYRIDKSKTTFLLNSDKTDSVFLGSLDSMGFRYIDLARTFSHANQPTTLIYDQHWNDYGRTLIAKSVREFLRDKNEYE